MTERIPCKEPGCTNTILPSTGESTGGICMPCHGRKKKAEWDEYVRKNKKVVDPFEGVSDPIEIIKIFHTDCKLDPLIEYKPLNRPLEEVYAGLIPAEAERLMAFAGEQIQLGTDDSINIAEAIAADFTIYTQHDTNHLLRAFVAENHFYPNVIFARANESIRDELLRKIASLDSSGDNHLLCALARIGDSAVVKLFAEWKSNPPIWQSNLYVPAHRYSEGGGWELDAQNKRRDLFFPVCHALTLAARGEQTSIQWSAPSSSTCPWCKSALSDILSIDMRQVGLSYLGWVPPALKVTLCGCFWYGTMYTKVNSDGSAVFHPKAEQPKVNPRGPADPIPQKSLVLSSEPRSALRGARVWDTHGSQIGGHPAWVQDSVYPACLDCGKTMKNFGQIVHDEVEPHTEGTFYFYLCADCSVTAVEYQQT